MSWREAVFSEDERGKGVQNQQSGVEASGKISPQETVQLWAELGWTLVTRNMEGTDLKDIQEKKKCQALAPDWIHTPKQNQVSGMSLGVHS